MFFARSRPLGLRTRLALWSSLVLGVSLAAGFVWVHQGLRRVLEAGNDAFLDRKAAELLAGVAGGSPESREALDAEIDREVEAYAEDGLVIVVREPGKVSVAPETSAARALSGLTVPVDRPQTIRLDDSAEGFRILRRRSAGGGLSLELGISLAETESILSEFDRSVVGGAFLFLIVAVGGGLFLSRQALRPMAEGIAAAKRLDPANLSERLPRTGARDELDELAETVNALLDRLAAYHVQIIRFTADASHELRSPLGAMRAAVEVTLQKPRSADEYRETLIGLGEQCERLTAMVNGLLLLARADAGEVALIRSPLDLSTLAAEVAEMYELVGRGTGHRLSLGMPSRRDRLGRRATPSSTHHQSHR